MAFKWRATKPLRSCKRTEKVGVYSVILFVLLFTLFCFSLYVYLQEYFAIQDLHIQLMASIINQELIGEDYARRKR